MSIAAVHKGLPSAVSSFVGTKEARPLVASVAEAFLGAGKEEESVAKSAPLDGRRCGPLALDEQDRNRVREIVDQLLKTKDVRGGPLLRTAMCSEEDERNVLKILRFLAENGFTNEVVNVLISERSANAIGNFLCVGAHSEEFDEIMAMLPQETQDYLRSVTYVEYGGIDDSNVYETFIIGGGSHRSS
ncbi:MAG: hypothetical protein LBR91_01475 [Puniceicoccales bacterium]|jgi:hypothetical protein|nr:hypothetical protein [Puniceicoccales bacterium]